MFGDHLIFPLSPPPGKKYPFEGRLLDCHENINAPPHEPHRARGKGEQRIEGGELKGEDAERNNEVERERERETG